MIIEVKNLTKKFGALTAVDNISFSVGKGEVFGFLGPNGAGLGSTLTKGNFGIFFQPLWFLSLR